MFYNNFNGEILIELSGYSKLEIILQTNDEILVRVEYLGRRAERVRETFRLHKEEVLLTGTLESLEKFREYSRVKYQIQLRAIKRDLLKEMSLIRDDDSGYEVTLEKAESVLIEIDAVQGHITSTPNRLIRVCKAKQIFENKDDASDDKGR